MEIIEWLETAAYFCESDENIPTSHRTHINVIPADYDNWDWSRVNPDQTA